MYLEYFDLKHRPFAITPDPGFMFWSEQHRAAYDTIRAEIGRNAPVTVLAGKAGAGKTHIINRLMQDGELGETHWVLLISNMFGDAAEILQRIALLLNRSEQGETAMWTGVSEGLAKIRRGGRVPLIIADEAQTLSPEGAEVLARLARDKTLGPVPILIAGQPELIRTIKHSDYKRLASAVGVSISLSKLSCDETAEYIRTRLTQAGATQDIFSAGAVNIIHKTAKGVPRLVNKLCDALLFFSAQAEMKTINSAAVRRTLDEFIDPVTLAMQPPTDGLISMSPEPPSEPPLANRRSGNGQDKTQPPEAVQSLRPVANQPVRPVPRVRQRRGRWMLPGVVASIAVAAAFLSPAGQQFVRDAIESASDSEAATAALKELDAQKLALEIEVAQATAMLAQTRGEERELARQAADANTQLARLRTQIVDEYDRLLLLQVKSANAQLLTTGQSVGQTIATNDQQVSADAALVDHASNQIDTLPPAPFRDANLDLASSVKPIAVASTPDAEAIFADAINQPQSGLVAAGYARAALRGHRRAARYLGQLFETGDGVAFAPNVADRWYAVADGANWQLDPAGTTFPTDADTSATPLFSAAAADGVDLIWDGQGTLFVVEISDVDGQLIGWFESPLTAARLDLPDVATSWRVRPAGQGASAWHPIAGRGAN